MKGNDKIYKLTVFISLLYVVLGAIAKVKTPINSDHPQTCWIANEERAIEIGEQFFSKGCIVGKCMEYHGHFYIEYTTCPSIHVPKGCSAVHLGPLNAKYPLCCPIVDCSQMQNKVQEDYLGPEYDEFLRWVDKHYTDSKEYHNY